MAGVSVAISVDLCEGESGKKCQRVRIDIRCGIHDQRALAKRIFFENLPCEARENKKIKYEL